MMVPTGVAEAYDGPRRGKRGREVDDHDVVLVRRGLESWETGVLAGGNLKRDSEKGGRGGGGGRISAPRWIGSRIVRFTRGGRDKDKS